MRLQIFVLVAAAALVTGILVLVPAAQAKPNGLIIHVNNHSLDQGDATPGNGICETANGNGVCTLRAAVQEANALAGSEIINLEVGQTYTLTRVGNDSTALDGDLDILSDVTINGNNSTLDVNGGVTHDHGFEINNMVSAIISDLTIENGNSGGSGGAIVNLGGTLTLDHVTLQNNTAVNNGGAVYSTGKLIIESSSIVNNHVTGNNGGGGLYISADSVIHNSAILNNTALGLGGGIYSGYGNIYVSNTTISGNSTNGNGGGVASTQAYLSLYNVTIAGNYADNDNAGGGDGGGLYHWNTGAITIKNTILANNYLETGVTDTADDCAGTISSAGYNIVRTTSGCTIVQGGGDKFSTDPKLGTLGNHGGVSQTWDLQANSPAIDSGDSGGCLSPYTGYTTLLTTDQRGYSRPANGGKSNTCDMGAFEYNGAAPISTVTPTNTPTAKATNTATATATHTATPTKTATVPATQTSNPCVGKPEVPGLVSPPNNGTVTSPKAKLDWSDPTCPATYRVLVKQDSKHGAKIAKKGNLAQSQFTTPKLAGGHTYFWRVWACNGADCAASAWSHFYKP